MSGIDVRDYQMVCTAPICQFPKEFELKMVRIKSQGNIGSCVAHALSSIIEYYNFVQNHDLTEMSTGYIYGNRNESSHKGTGMVLRDALEVVRKYGDVPKENFPYNVEVPLAITLYENNSKELFEYGYPHRISQYCKVNTSSAMKKALLTGNPILIAMNWYGDMKVVNGILTTSFKRHNGAHCMLIYGWNEKGWKVQNSYGKFWGNNGTAIIPYDMNITECWTVTDDVIEGTTIRKPFSSNVGKNVAKIVNRICNPFKIKT